MQSPRDREKRSEKGRDISTSGSASSSATARIPKRGPSAGPSGGPAAPALRGSSPCACGGLRHLCFVCLFVHLFFTSVSENPDMLDPRPSTSLVCSAQ